jgi:WhiB family transcriptional regulator, redox-sensing transcriptional regulator
MLSVELSSSEHTTSSVETQSQLSPTGSDLSTRVTEAPKPAMVVAPASIVGATWNNLAWRGHRACADIDTNVFFPLGLTGNAIEQTNLAKSICQSCPVSGPCLEFALRTLQDFGIWGGRTEDERRIIRRARRAAARKATAAAAAAAAAKAAEF